MKLVLITGASKGLGLELARFMAPYYKLALVSRHTESLEELSQAYPQVSLFNEDLTELQNIKNLVLKIEQKAGQAVDILVNNAGASVSGRMEDIPIEEYDRILKLNYLSCVLLTQQIFPSMKKRKDGQVVFITSGVARRALPYEAPYCAAKAALHSFSDSLRVEAMHTGVVIQTFSPGPVSSNFQAAKVHYGPGKLTTAFKGKSAKKIAKKLLQAIEHKEERVFLGTKAWIAHELNHFLPSLLDKIIHKNIELK